MRTLSTRDLTDKQRDSIKQAARDFPRFKVRGLDVVDLATETNNYFWTGLDDHLSRVALRFIAGADLD
jgi:hypothetical protein